MVGRVVGMVRDRCHIADGNMATKGQMTNDSLSVVIDITRQQHE